jgi:glycosyltransferase involved in cell wall biosynthesis
VRSYPRLSQTFILAEILALEALGVGIEIFSLSNPREPLVQPEVAAVRAPVHYLDADSAARRLLTHLRVALRWPRRYLRAVSYLWRRRREELGYATVTRAACFDRALRLGLLLDRGRLRSAGIRHLHAHFAHDPTLVALLTAIIAEVPFTFTAHARDLYQVPAVLLRDRVERAHQVVTCCRANVDYLGTVAPHATGKVRLIYHGVDLAEFRPLERAARSGGSDPPVIISVGRLVQKKGFSVLLAACRRLQDSGRRLRCVLYGDGPLQQELETEIRRLGLVGQVTLAGARTRRELVTCLQEADVFALTPCITEDGDRDGVPNVLVEAMACGVPVVSTTVGGIPELVRHDVNGLLAPPADVETITGHLAALLDDGGLRARLGRAARATVVERFDLRSAATQLAAVFGAEEAADDRTSEGASA